MAPKRKDDKTAQHEKTRSKAAESIRKYKEFLSADYDFEMPDLDFDIPEPIKTKNEALQGNEIHHEAQLFLDSDVHRNILKDKVTVSDSWKKLAIICKTQKHYALTSREQLKLVQGLELTLFDTCLLTGPPLPCLSMFSAALKASVEANTSGNGPSLDQCLSWLAFAGQTNVEDIVPAGEYFTDATEHIKNKLTQQSLSEIEAEDRRDLAVYHVMQTLEFLKNCNLSSIKPIDKAILLFAMSRLVLDEQISNTSVIQDKAIKFISHVITNSENPKEIVWEFGQLLPNLCDDMRGLRTILNLFRQSAVEYPACMCLLGFIFVHVSERGEWAPSKNYDLTNEKFVNEYAVAINELMNNVMDVFKEEKPQQAAIISMMDCALHPSALPVLKGTTITGINDRLRYIKRELKKSGHTDDAILETLINNILNRTREDSTKFGFEALATTTDDDDDDMGETTL